MNPDMFIDIDISYMQKHVKVQAISSETFSFHGTILSTMQWWNGSFVQKCMGFLGGLFLTNHFWFIDGSVDSIDPLIESLDELLAY